MIATEESKKGTLPALVNPPAIHEGCGGEFFFTTHHGGPRYERVCRKCGATEHLTCSYEPDQLIVIGRKGVSEERLKDRCEMLRLTVQSMERDVSSQDVIAATVSVPRDYEINIETWLAIIEKDIAGDDQVIHAAFRKPRTAYQRVVKK